jgi:hypothetical protein
MGYSFGASANHKLNGGALTRATTASSAAFRFKINAANTAVRTVGIYEDAGSSTWNYRLRFSTGTTNQITYMFSRDGGGNTTLLTWTTGFAAGTTHTIVTTYDGANMRIYADTDSTAKVSQAETGTPLTTGSLAFFMGGNAASGVNSLDGVMYETAWWPTTTLTGAQAAQFGAGFTADMLRPLPSNHWLLIGDAVDHIGGVAASVTGATLVAHTPIYRPTSVSVYAAAVSTFTLGAGIRRTLSELGTRMGSRQAQEN